CDQPPRGWCRAPCPPARSVPPPRPPRPERQAPPPPSRRYPGWHRRRTPPSRQGSFRREPQRPVQTNDFAVEIVVFDDALRQLRVLRRTAHPLRERHLWAPVLLELIGRLAVGRGVDGARRDRADTNAERRKVARCNECHAEHAALGGGVGQLTDLS